MPVPSCFSTCARPAATPRLRPAGPAVALVALAMSLAVAMPAVATDLASSAASSAGSATVGSVSDSFEASSGASSGERRAQAGEYRVAAIEPVPARPGFVRVRLAAVDAATAAPGPHAHAWAVLLPEATARRAGLLRGAAITVREAPHGFEFAAGEPRATFFLALTDAALREFTTRPL